MVRLSDRKLLDRSGATLSQQGRRTLPIDYDHLFPWKTKTIQSLASLLHFKSWTRCNGIIARMDTAPQIMTEHFSMNWLWLHKVPACDAASHPATAAPSVFPFLACWGKRWQETFQMFSKVPTTDRGTVMHWQEPSVLLAETAKEWRCQHIHALPKS